MTLIPDSLWIDSPPSTEKAVSVYRGLNINKQPSYIRAIKVSFKALTTYKKKRIHGMIRAYRQTVNAYIRHFYSHCLNLKGSPFKLDSTTLALLPKGYMGLTERYKSQALKQALQVLKSVDSSKKEQKAQHLTGQRQASCPVFKGYPALSSKTVAIMPAETMRQFDWVCHLSTFQKGKKLSLPFKGHRRLNHWLDLLSDETVYAQSQSGLLQSVELREDCLILYVQGTFQQGALIPHYKGDRRSQLESACDYVKYKAIPLNSIYGLDIGINKLACLVNSSDPTELIDPELEALLGKRPTNVKDEPNQVGESSAMMGVWQQMMLDKRLRKKKGSKSFKRATKEYKDVINHAINQLLGYLLKDKKEPLKVLVIERIKWIKFKKSSQKLLLWLCSWCFERLTHWCQVNRVVLVKVSPRYTSQQCAFCRVVTKSNRRGEWYQSQCCVNCHVDADMNGAYNIRDRFIQVLKQRSLYQEPVKPAPHLKRKRSVSLPKI